MLHEIKVLEINVTKIRKLSGKRLSNKGSYRERDSNTLK